MANGEYRWFTVWFHLKRMCDGEKWTIYLVYARTDEEAIQRVEQSRSRDGFANWRRSEDTEAIEVDEEEYKSGLMKVYICT